MVDDGIQCGIISSEPICMALSNVCVISWDRLHLCVARINVSLSVLKRNLAASVFSSHWRRIFDVLFPSGEECFDFAQCLSLCLLGNWCLDGWNAFRNQMLHVRVTHFVGSNLLRSGMLRRPAWAVGNYNGPSSCQDWWGWVTLYSQRAKGCVNSGGG